MMLVAMMTLMLGSLSQAQELSPNRSKKDHQSLPYKFRHQVFVDQYVEEQVKEVLGYYGIDHKTKLGKDSRKKFRSATQTG